MGPSPENVISPSNYGIQHVCSLSLGFLISHYGGYQLSLLFSMLLFSLAYFSLPHSQVPFI